MIEQVRLNELCEEVGADDLHEVIDMFCEEVQETLDRITTHTPPSLVDDLHFLKGCALNIGMSDVGQLCQSAEMKLRSDPSATANISEIVQSFQRSRQALELMLDR